MTPIDDFFDLLSTAYGKVADQPAPDVAPETTLDALGMDSVQTMEMQVLVEAELGVPLPDNALHGARTLADVCDLLSAAASVPGPRSTPHTSSDTYAALPSPGDGSAHGVGQTVGQLSRLGLRNPYFVPHEGLPGGPTLVDGTPVTSFSSYDYLGLAADSHVTRAAKEAIDRYGTSVSASRAVSGERLIHRRLETALATHLGVEQALVLPGGHATNVAVLGQLAGPGDLVVYDALAHNSIVQGAQLSGAARRFFPHNDPAALDRLLEAHRHRYGTVVVAVEGVYSMDGDLADLPALVQLRGRHGIVLYLDEAHSVGVLGERGAGAAEHWGVAPGDVDVHMGTLSKALASCGGYVAGDSELITRLRHTTPGFLYSVGTPPSVAAAALTALEQLSEKPQLAATARETAQLFRELARDAGINTGASSDGSCVVPVLTGEGACALRLADRLLGRGISVAPILPPAVPEAQSRLRFFLTARHTERQLRDTVRAVAEELPALRG